MPIWKKPSYKIETSERGGNMNKKTPLLIDCDPGHDDAIAIMIALASEKIELKGITTVGGNQTVEKTTNNALKILELFNRTDVPVAMGKSRTLFKEVEVADGIHGDSGMDGPVLPEPVTKAVDQNAIDFIADILRESTEQVVVAVTGPCTNIATFILSYPDLLPKIKYFSIMGGGIWEGNSTPVAEFNIWQDPEAARIIFKSGVPIRLFGLDVTHKNMIMKEEIKLFTEKPGKAHQFIGELLEFFAKAYIGERKYPGCPIHDACAIATIIDEDMYEGTECYLDVELEGALTRGACIVDLRAPERRLEATNAVVYHEANRKKFLQLVFDTCETLEAESKGAHAHVEG